MRLGDGGDFSRLVRGGAWRMEGGVLGIRGGNIGTGSVRGESVRCGRDVGHTSRRLTAGCSIIRRVGGLAVYLLETLGQICLHSLGVFSA